MKTEYNKKTNSINEQLKNAKALLEKQIEAAEKIKIPSGSKATIKVPEIDMKILSDLISKKRDGIDATTKIKETIEKLINQINELKKLKRTLNKELPKFQALSQQASVIKKEAKNQPIDLAE